MLNLQGPQPDQELLKLTFYQIVRICCTNQFLQVKYIEYVP